METSFLQSKEWEEFQISTGKECFRWQGILFIRQPLPYKKTFLYCPRVRINPELFKSYYQLKEQLNLYLKNSDLFIKIEPLNTLDLNFSYPSPATQPRVTTVLNLNQSEETLLAQMKQKTRYNINLAKKKQVQVDITTNPEEKEFERFWTLLEQTSNRDQFSLHSKNYYRQMLTILGQAGISHLVQAKLSDKLIATMILITYQKEAIYLHGASDYDYRNLMAPYLLQWKAIQFAISQGCQSYDFWGIKLPKGTNLEETENLEGVTRFKLGFGGEIKEFPFSLEIPLRKMQYYGYRTMRMINRTLKPRTFG